jgi:hypothetical protein
MKHISFLSVNYHTLKLAKIDVCPLDFISNKALDVKALGLREGTGN